MTVRIRIGTKIFGLALFLMSLTVALPIFSTRQARQIHSELNEMAEYYIPLEDLIEKLSSDGLRERLAFERWFTALSVPSVNSAFIEEASANYRTFNDAAQQDFKRIDALLHRISPQPDDAPDVANIRTLLAEVQRDYPLSSGLEQRILDHERKGDRVAARELLGVYEGVQQNIQSRRDHLRGLIESLDGRSERTAEDLEDRLVVVTSIATLSAILLGLMFAFVTTRRLVRPVRNLMSGVDSVEKGDLTVRIPVSSTDEIGVLTRSFNGLVEELRSKQRMKETFGKYIDPRIVEQVLLNPSAAEIEGGRREMTVSFCDLVGFTTLGEDMTPTGLVRLLNRHFALMSEAIQQNQGVLDKFIGDAVMAFWGPPFCLSSEHAEKACRCALAKIQALEVFRAGLPELTGMRKNLPRIDLRIGLASGDVVVGNIGSDNSRSYTVMGDTVNLASRLEGINRLYGTTILINEHARSLTRAVIETREIDTIAVKGKSESAHVFEVLGLVGEVSDERLRCRERYEAGLSEYRVGNWRSAKTAFQEARAVTPEDGPSALFQDRVAHFEANPPPADWDGVWRLTKK